MTKTVKVEYVRPADEPALYELLNDLIQQHHRHLEQCQIALVWRSGWKADKDGKMKFGTVYLTADLDKEFADHDAVIQLNKDLWDEFSAEQQRMVLDHECCHIERATDKEGRPTEDDRGRAVYRLKHHDLEEFRAIVDRYGVNISRDLEEFAKVVLERTESPLFAGKVG